MKCRFFLLLIVAAIVSAAPALADGPPQFMRLCPGR